MKNQIGTRQPICHYYNNNKALMPKHNQYATANKKLNDGNLICLPKIQDEEHKSNYEINHAPHKLNKIT